jgi:hypothetical protein
MKKKKQKARQKIVRQLVPKAALAMKNEFFLEASIIISALIELRLRNMLARFEKAPAGAGLDLNKGIKRVKYLIVKNPDSLISKNFELRLIDGIREWKNRRNSIFRDMVDIHVSKNRMKKLAKDGILLFQDLNAANKKFKRELKKEVERTSITTSSPDETSTNY